MNAVGGIDLVIAVTGGAMPAVSSAGGWPSLKPLTSSSAMAAVTTALVVSDSDGYGAASAGETLVGPLLPVRFGAFSCDASTSSLLVTGTVSAVPVDVAPIV